MASFCFSLPLAPGWATLQRVEGKYSRQVADFGGTRPWARGNMRIKILIFVSVILSFFFHGSFKLLPS